MPIVQRWFLSEGFRRLALLQREAVLPRLPVGLEGTGETMRPVAGVGLRLPGRQRRLRQCALEFAGLDVDDADGIIVAVDERLAIGRECQTSDNTTLAFECPHELSGRDVPEPDFADDLGHAVERPVGPSPPLATVLPSGAIATACTPPVWPSSVCMNPSRRDIPESDESRLGD